MRPIEARIKVDKLQLPGGSSRCDDLRPTAVHELTEQDERGNATNDVHTRLQNLRPDDGTHATAIGVDNRQCTENEHRRRHHPLPRHHALENERDRYRRREDTHRVGEAARHHEYDRREAPCREAESLLEQRVRRHQLALIIAGQQHRRDDDATEQIADRHLQKSEVSDVRQTRNADERQRARLTGDNGEHHRPPWDCTAGDEVVLGVTLPPADPDAEERRAGEISEDDERVECGEAARHAPVVMRRLVPLGNRSYSTTYASIAKYSARPSRSSSPAVPLLRASTRCQNSRSS